MNYTGAIRGISVKIATEEGVPVGWGDRDGLQIGGAGVGAIGEAAMAGP